MERSPASLGINIMGKLDSNEELLKAIILLQLMLVKMKWLTKSMNKRLIKVIECEGGCIT